MPTVNGRVDRVSSKKVNTRYGEKDTFSVQVNGEWFSNGFKRLNEIGEGDEVSIEYAMNGAYKNITMINKVAGGSGSTPTTRASGPNRGGSRGGADVQQAIIRQNALGHATDIVIACKTAKSKPEDMIKDVVKYARVFEHFADGTLEAVAESEATDAILSE